MEGHNISPDKMEYSNNFVYWDPVCIGTPGPSCSSLANVSLNFQMLISRICQYFLLKKCEKLLSFFQQKISVY